MCTAISFKTNDHYFGRTLDINCEYDTNIIITPRNYPVLFRKAGEMSSHFAIIGTGIVKNDFPLYFDATNEFGLSVAGLNFPDNCVYNAICDDKCNLSPFELILWILGKFKSVDELCEQLSKINICDISFDEQTPCSPLHWLISDKNRSITVEKVADGLKIYENTVGVLTNNPTFDMHMWNLSNYMNITSLPPENRFSDNIELKPYCFGMGGIGLPGDLSSASRFVRAVFVKNNSVCHSDENSSVSQFFHILGSVVQQRGCAKLSDGSYETTYYTSCCNTDKGIYYYTTYLNSQISAVDINKEDLNNNKLVVYDMIKKMNINYQN